MDFDSHGHTVKSESPRPGSMGKPFSLAATTPLPLGRIDIFIFETKGESVIPTEAQRRGGICFSTIAAQTFR
jgi:hypothetical protein